MEDWLRWLLDLEPELAKLSLPAPVLDSVELALEVLWPLLERYHYWIRTALAHPAVQRAQDYLVVFLFHWLLLVLAEYIWRNGPLGMMRNLAQSGSRWAFALLRRLPGVQSKIDRELGKVLHEIESKLEPTNLPKLRSLPATGWTDEELRQRVGQYKALDKVDWRNGRVSGTVYHGGKELSRMLTEVYGEFSHTNPLHPDVFPSIRKMEAEVISMCVQMYNGNPQTACGSVTSGGTESILMACKSYRERGRQLKGITQPEMVVPVTVHAAFDKAAGYFGIKIVHAPVDPVTRKVNVKQVKSLINTNTILIAGSAPNYPYGVIDDIEALGKLAQQYDIGLHVDCCLGSFIVPFLKKAGYSSPQFDFRVSGVTSISCDTHKFGFAPKGSSVVMYRDAKLRKYQYFVAPNWPGGIYASPSIAGSRPGALVAACWAAMNKMGESGYIEATKSIVGAARRIADGIRKIPGIELCGEPDAMVVAFTSNTLSVYSVADEMTSKGWNLNTLQYPAAIHICCTMPTVPVVDQFLSDLKNAVKAVRTNPNAKKDGMGAIYGMAASIPDKSLVEDIAKGYLDILTKV